MRATRLDVTKVQQKLKPERREEKRARRLGEAINLRKHNGKLVRDTKAQHQITTKRKEDLWRA